MRLSEDSFLPFRQKPQSLSLDSVKSDTDDIGFRSLYLILIKTTHLLGVIVVVGCVMRLRTH